MRFISISEGIDSDKGEDEFTPFRNLMNEWYARDISKKRKLTNIVKGNAGEPLSEPPYGYIKDPDNPKRWLIEPEAAAVVCRIFEMTMDGKSMAQIADVLESEEILSPTFYWLERGVSRPSKKPLGEEPTRWGTSTVIKILKTQEYCGDVINFKTFSKSFKLKKRIKNSEENMMVFKDVHEPIVEREVWEAIQKKRAKKTRVRKTDEGVSKLFSGLLVCADCGCNMHYHFNQGNPDIKYFNCSNYKGNRGTCLTTHYIRYDFLEQVMLQEIRRLTKFASKHEGEFVKLLAGSSKLSLESDRQRKQKELNAMIARDRELDKLFNRIYEDNAAGKIDDNRFAKMSKQYTLEQKELAEKTKKVGAELARQADTAATANIFVSAVRKYTRAKTLSQRMLNELIERIGVYQSEKVDGVHVQRLAIHYNCVGAIEIPVLPKPDIIMQTRKGVQVSYSAAQ